MVDTSKITEKAAELASQAVAAAGPLKDKAEELAEQAVQAAGPLKDKAVELAEKAGELAAQGVAVAAEGIDKATGGKYSDKISSVSSKIEDVLDHDKNA